MKTLPHTRSCFVCGEANPLGLALKFETDGRVVRARFTPRPEHIGFKQTIHGGILATLLDEIMVWACGVGTGRFAYCAEMTVRFNTPAQPGEELLASAELVANRRGRLFEAKAELRSARGELVASSTGKYLPMKPEIEAEMRTELIGDFNKFA
ncbi:MAG: PaaI family thioesterase [Verrucomicrobia bacterium]|nr:PaaI family thioesterase [Verrucomicrobiota bacterium]